MAIKSTLCKLKVCSKINSSGYACQHLQYVTGPAKINHVSAKIANFFIFALL